MNVDDTIVEYLRGKGFPVSRDQLLADLAVAHSNIATRGVDESLARLLRERRIRSPFGQHYDIEQHVLPIPRFIRDATRRTIEAVSPRPAPAGCMESPTRKVGPAASESPKKRRGAKPKLNDEQAAELLRLYRVHLATGPMELCKQFGITWPTYRSTLRRLLRESGDAGQV